MARYLIHLFVPIASRAVLRDVVKGITRVDHSAALTTANDTGGANSQTQASFTVDDMGLAIAAGLASNNKLVKMVIQTVTKTSVANRTREVLFSQVSSITVGSSYSRAQIVTLMQSEFTTTDPDIVGGSGGTLNGLPFTQKVEEGVGSAPDWTTANTFLFNSVGSIDVLTMGTDEGVGLETDWVKSEVIFGPKGYGRYEIWVIGRVDLFDSAQSFGNFIYGGTSQDDDEIGFEQGGVVSGDISHAYYFYWTGEALATRNQTFTTSEYVTRWVFEWTADGCTWTVYDRDGNLLFTHSDDEPDMPQYTGGSWRLLAFPFNFPAISPTSYARLSYMLPDHTPAA